MSATASAIVLAWIAIFLLASAFAGLVIRFAELRRDLEVGLNLRAGADRESVDGLRLGPDSYRAFAQPLGLSRRSFAALVVDSSCGACRQAAQDLERLLPMLSLSDVLVVAEHGSDLSSWNLEAVEIKFDDGAWASVPGVRPVLVVGDVDGEAIFQPVSSREDVIRTVSPFVELQSPKEAESI